MNLHKMRGGGDFHPMPCYNCGEYFPCTRLNGCSHPGWHEYYTHGHCYDGGTWEAAWEARGKIPNRWDRKRDIQ